MGVKADDGHYRSNNYRIYTYKNSDRLRHIVAFKDKIKNPDTVFTAAGILALSGLPFLYRIMGKSGGMCYVWHAREYVDCIWNELLHGDTGEVR